MARSCHFQIFGLHIDSFLSSTWGRAVWASVPRLIESGAFRLFGPKSPTAFQPGSDRFSEPLGAGPSSTQLLCPKTLQLRLIPDACPPVILLRSVSTFSEFAKFFGLAFSALLPVVNPLGSALVFLGLVGEAPAAVYRDLARQVAIRTILFFLVIELVGTALLTFFGISLPVVQVAGGLVLASMGWNLLNQQAASPRTDSATVTGASYGSVEEKVFYPLTFPVTVDPACIVVMLTLSAHASVKNLSDNVVSHAAILSAVLVLSLIVYISYAYAPKITERISPQTAHGILRIIAFVLLCIGVQISWNGVQALIRIAMNMRA